MCCHKNLQLTIFVTFSLIGPLVLLYVSFFAQFSHRPVPVPRLFAWQQTQTNRRRPSHKNFEHSRSACIRIAPGFVPGIHFQPLLYNMSLIYWLNRHVIRPTKMSHRMITGQCRMRKGKYEAIFDLFKFFIRATHRHQVPFRLEFGSLLGAIRF